MKEIEINKDLFNKPIVGNYATSYAYTDRYVHYIAKVDKKGEVFWTKDVERCFMRPEYVATFTKDANKVIRITIKYVGNDKTYRHGSIIVNNKIFFNSQPEDNYWLYLRDELMDDSVLNRWQLLSDGRYHRSRYDMFTKKYKNSMRNMIIVPNRYDYYYDSSF